MNWQSVSQQPCVVRYEARVGDLIVELSRFVYSRSPRPPQSWCWSVKSPTVYESGQLPAKLGTDLAKVRAEMCAVKSLRRRRKVLAREEREAVRRIRRDDKAVADTLRLMEKATVPA